MAAVEEWYFEDEGCIKLNCRPVSITYSPSSNCFVYTLDDGSVEVVDVRSGSNLKRTVLAGECINHPRSSTNALEWR